jgi:hypothetical protein
MLNHTAGAPVEFQSRNKGRSHLDRIHHFRLTVRRHTVSLLEVICEPE